MCGMLDHYLEAFSRLSIEVAPHSWPAATTHRSPGKPLLLLSVLDLIANGGLHRNFIEPSAELNDRFDSFLGLLPPLKGSVLIAESFVGLESDGFWQLRPRAGYESLPGQEITSVERLRVCYFGAILNDDLFPLLQMRTSREKLRTVLVASYFAHEFQTQVSEYVGGSDI